MRSRFIWFISIMFFCPVAQAQDSVFKASVQSPLDEVYTSVYAALEDNRFFVVFEVNMGKTMSRFAERWGEDYNRNGLTGIRSMVACNIWYTNQVSNKDPAMLSLCPLTLTLYHKAGETTVLFARPTVIAKGSAAEPVIKELEKELISAIQQGLH